MRARDFKLIAIDEFGKNDDYAYNFSPVMLKNLKKNQKWNDFFKNIRSENVKVNLSKFKVVSWWLIS